ncbi:patatin-like phospholipase family protein [Luteimonas aquatica]|uniref:patatin-like phospholipase family protein n=1 Tax=Luteimonas aquatica TaxID=450364 RepID=UPI001F5919D8|nr:patatin-like phospholipase family protein [Luteimonas aquatica]
MKRKAATPGKAAPRKAANGKAAKSAAPGRGKATRTPPERQAPARKTAAHDPLAAIRASVALYPSIALVLQGGGALGAYQCGVYEGLHEAGIRPNWFAGISIGAINAAILAGNAPERRLERLREFWELICRPSGSLALPAEAIRLGLSLLPGGAQRDAWVGWLGAMGALLQGQRGFFTARQLPPFLYRDGSDAAVSFYDTAPLRETLERLVDFDRINHDKTVRLTVGATEADTGNFEYFDSRRTRIRPEHIMASGALPPAFAAVEIDGKRYWDGGLVSNTPLERILGEWPRHDTLALQVDLWSARGPRPQTMMDVLERVKDIQYSSRTRRGTYLVARIQQLRAALTELIDGLPDRQVPEHLRETLAPYLDDRVYNVIHLIYQAKPLEEQFKDYAFAHTTMRLHWDSGLEDMARTLQHPAFFVLPDRSRGMATHDVHRIMDRLEQKNGL